MGVVKAYSFRADEKLIDKVDRLAEELGVTRGEIIRRALVLFLKSVGGKL